MEIGELVWVSSDKIIQDADHKLSLDDIKLKFSCIPGLNNALKYIREQEIKKINEEKLSLLIV